MSKVSVPKYRHPSIGTKLFPTSKSIGTGVSEPVSGTGKKQFLVSVSVSALFLAPGHL